MAKKVSKVKPKRAGAARGRGAGAAKVRSAARAARGAPKLLSGGNPQIAKGDGEGPVRAYIEAMPGWKREVGRRIDEIVTRAVPRVKKAVRWNSPFWGIEGNGWFMSLHCIERYVKVCLFSGASLTPAPPVGSKKPGVRYFHVHEEDVIDEKLVAGWAKQAAALPGERCFE